MSQGFRTQFGKLTRGLNWYPKHMNTGLKQMQAKLRAVDCVLELHDARIPFSGRNPTFADTVIADKPHILVLNKADLISSPAKRRIQELLLQNGQQNVLFTSAKNDQDQGIKKLVPLMRKLIEASDRYHRADKNEYHAMIIGVPNVGKSSLINMLRSKHLRKGRALKVGPSAGVTKSVHEKVRICEAPPIFLFDTPGILTPKVDGDDMGLKLAACANLPDHDVGKILIADYILFHLNRTGNRSYLRPFGLSEPSDCITTVLTKAALHLNHIQTFRAMDQAHGLQRKPDFLRVATLFIDKFRVGEFGKIVLDDLGPVSEAAPYAPRQLTQNETFSSS